jgi:hypothetical protein
VREIPLIHAGGDFAFASGHDYGGSIPLLHHERLRCSWTAAASTCGDLKCEPPAGVGESSGVQNLGTGSNNIAMRGCVCFTSTASMRSRKTDRSRRANRGRDSANRLGCSTPGGGVDRLVSRSLAATAGAAEALADR